MLVVKYAFVVTLAGFFPFISIFRKKLSIMLDGTKPAGLIRHYVLELRCMRY